MSQPPEWSAPDDPASGRPDPQQPGPYPGQYPGQPPAQPGWGPPPVGPGAPGPGAPGPPPPPAPGGWGQPAPGWGQQRPPGWAPQAPRPGIIPLRPITLGEMYDGAFRAIRTNPRTMIGISAVVIAVTALLTTAPQAAALVSFGGSDLFDPEAVEQLSPRDVATSLSSLLGSLLVPALIQVLAITVVTGLLIVAVSNAVLGRKTTAGQLWQRSKRRVPALIGLALLLILFSLLLPTLLALPGVALLLADQIAVGVIVLILGLLLAVLGYLAIGYGFWSLAAPAMLLEDLTVFGALGRSWRLVRPAFWRVFGIMLLTTVLVSVVSGFISVPFTVIGTLVGLGQDQPYSSFPLTLLQLGISQVGSVLAGAVLYPFSAAVTALLYIDLRMRQEGLDVDLMRAAEEPLR
jgi:hypothetical protein